MKILVISKEAWRDEQNGGNILSNLFAGLNAEFAQIYCNEREPNNKICRCYFQITDRGMVNSLLGRGKAGRVVEYEHVPNTQITSNESFSGGRKWLGSYLTLFRELVWWFGSWNKDEMLKFVKEFNPDIVFAPCYGSHYMHKILRQVHGVAKVPVVSYISDDHYTCRQFRFTPSFWINHMFLRKHTYDIFKHYSLVYTMTDEQKAQCEKDFGARMKILRKAGSFNPKYEKTHVNHPIRLVYAGGLYLNRWKTLGKLAEAIRKINMDGVKLQLDIYSNNPLTKKMQRAINDGISSTVHSVVSMEKLMEIYHNSDIALHVEGFDIKNVYTVRMSFSTKIVDCLDSGCAVMAICDQQQAGSAYLKRNDSGICVSDCSKLEETLKRLVDDPEIIIHYQHKAFELGRRNHRADETRQMILNDFNELMEI